MHVQNLLGILEVAHLAVFLLIVIIYIYISLIEQNLSNF